MTLASAVELSVAVRLKYGNLLKVGSKLPWYCPFLMPEPYRTLQRQTRYLYFVLTLGGFLLNHLLLNVHHLNFQGSYARIHSRLRSVSSATLLMGSTS